MNKKKRCKKAQITIFIIVGLVIVFAAIFVFQLAKKVQMGELGEARENVIGKAFRKEGLRLCVEDTLEDELKEGLVMIGKQGGKIWEDNPGGRERDIFLEGETGITIPLSGEKVSYAITNGTYLPDNQYPCKKGEEPDFCKYKYPNGSILLNHPIKFGGNELSVKAIEGNLERFLIEKVIKETESCMKRDIPGVEVLTGDLEIDLDILSEGIKVDVTYPLTLSSAGEEFFHLAEFDFLYDSNLKKLLDAAITLPLKLDWSFVDFDYTENSLKASEVSVGEGEEEKSFTMRKSEYEEELGVEFNREEVGSDDLFVFEVSGGITGDKPYTFQFVRQNRPPALDYVERDSCEEDGYDYLVIEGAEGPDGEIDITLSAQDPDEDTVSYAFESEDFPNKEGDRFVESPAEGWYNITTIAKDEHELSDSQTVRILVDRVIKTDVSLRMPYTVKEYESQEIKPYEDLMASWEEDYYIISNEDPVFVDVTIPVSSLVEDASPETTLVYNKEADFNYILPESLSLSGEGGCFSLPWLRSATCDVNDYDEEDLENWKNQLEDSSLGFRHFRELTEGKLGLTFAITYCGENEQSDAKEVSIRVEECVPHVDANYPFAYPYHTYQFDDEGNFLGIDEEDIINPFLATHSCCAIDWTIYGEDHKCFVDPVPGCYGGNVDSKRNFVLETKNQHCDGERGNICGGDLVYELGTSNKPDQIICGDPDLPECSSSIPEACRQENAWSYGNLGGDVGWCYGNDQADSGCEDFCSQEEGEEIVYKYVLSGSIYQFSEITTNLFKCGCELEDELKPCDHDFNGVFDRKCRGGSCIWSG